jgi:hypothetical protein
MSKIDIITLKSKFQTGDIPTESDFSDFIDSTYNVNNGDGTLFLANDATYKSTTTYVDAGVLVKPTFTDNANGTITLGDGTYVLYENSLTYPPHPYVITGNTFTLTDQSINYITANYNNGNPVIENSTSRANINQLDVVPLYTIYRNGINLVYLDWDHQSIGLANKLADRLVRTRRYEAEPDGLVLGEVPTRIVTITAGAVWSGGNKYVIDSFRSDTNQFVFHYHVNGAWVKQLGITAYNNTQYDDGTNLQTLANNSYGVVWIVKRIGTPSNSACMVLGTQSYTLAQAVESKIPPLPPELNALGLVIGRIIVLKSSDTAYQIDSIFETQFGNTSVNDHLHLSNLQGGTDGEYYHLTLSDYNKTVDSPLFNDFTESASGQLLLWNNDLQYWDVSNNVNLNENGVDGVVFSTNLDATPRDFRIQCGTEKTVVLNDIVWVDIDFPIIIKTTGTGIPTLGTLMGTLIAPIWQVNDNNMCEGQELIHGWKEGSQCFWHIHLITNGTDTTDRYVKFQIEYTWATLNGVLQPITTTDSLELVIPANTLNRTHKIYPIASFTPTEAKISTQVYAKLYRIASTGTAPTLDPFVPMLQMHVQVDTIGSRRLGNK